MNTIIDDHVAMLHHGKLLLCDQLDTVMNQHTQCVFRLPEGAENPTAIPGTISCTGKGREWSAVCNGQRPQFDEWLTQNGAEIVEETSPSLEDIFVARSGAGIKASDR